MASYHVVPDGKTWKVTTERGVDVSTGHRKKNLAIKEMDEAADPGDSKYVHENNGQVTEHRTHRG